MFIARQERTLKVGNKMIKEKEILISFDIRYSKEEKRSIINILQSKFEANQSEKNSSERFYGPISPSLLIIIILIAIPLESFLKGFFTESGRILARRLFLPMKRDKRIEYLTLRIIHKHTKIKRKLDIAAIDTDELYSKIEELLLQRRNRDVRNL